MNARQRAIIAAQKRVVKTDSRIIKLRQRIVWTKERSFKAAARITAAQARLTKLDKKIDEMNSVLDKVEISRTETVELLENAGAAIYPIIESNLDLELVSTEPVEEIVEELDQVVAEDITIELVPEVDIEPESFEEVIEDVELVGSEVIEEIVEPPSAPTLREKYEAAQKIYRFEMSEVKNHPLNYEMHMGPNFVARTKYIREYELDTRVYVNFARNLGIEISCSEDQRPKVYRYLKEVFKYCPTWEIHEEMTKKNLKLLEKMLAAPKNCLLFQAATWFNIHLNLSLHKPETFSKLLEVPAKKKRIVRKKV